MIKKCSHLKQGFYSKITCKKKKKLIKISECLNCKYKEYDTPIYNNEKKLKNKTYNQVKKEKERYSIIYKDLTKCALCPSKVGIEKNEVYEGAKRGSSIKHGFVIPLCKKHHEQFHNDREFALSIKRQFQKEFEKTHTRDEFLDIVYRNYL